MIYLNAEVVSGLGEDTFWTWFKREFPTSVFEIPTKLNDDDILLRYSTLGFFPIKGKQVSLCWELYPEMKRFFCSNQWDTVIDKVYETAKYSTYRTVATSFSIPFYEKFGSVDIIPIGVDTDIFKPLDQKTALREKYGIPQDKKVGFWIGTLHPMKGFSDLLHYVSLNPDVYWIVVWKWDMEAGHLEGASNFVHIRQSSISELINAADFALFTSKLKPYYMAEWEIMACDIPIIFANDTKREFEILPNPRDTVINMGWDRKTVKQTWEKYLLTRGITW